MSKTRSPWDTRLMNTDRLARGWSYSDLAEAAGVSVSAVTRFFGGDSQAPKMAKRLALALDYPVTRYLRDRVSA